MTTAFITVTERAAQRIAEIVCNEPDKKMFRIGVEGGGCSGFEYRFDLVLKAEPEDAVIEHADAKILVDSLSLVYLAGSEIDYVDDLLSASFKIKNPNATPPAAAAQASRSEADPLRDGLLALAYLNRAYQNLCPDYSATFTTVVFDDSSLRLEINT